MLHVKIYSCCVALVGRGTAGAHHPSLLKASNKAGFVCLQIKHVLASAP